MQRTSFVTTEKNDSTTEHLVLIVDKAGIIGEAIAKRLSEELTVVYVSKRLSPLVNYSKSLIHVPYNAKFPSIPENAYSYIFIIDDGTKITRGALPKFIEKAERDNSQLIFALHISSVSEKQIAKLINNPRITRIIIYGDIFSNEKIHDYKTSQFIVNKFIQQAQRFGEIKVFGDGLRKTYPVFLEDVIDAILEVVFVQNNLFSIFCLYPKHAPTEISLAHMIQKASPDIRIDFVQEKRREKESIVLPSFGKHLLNDNYRLSERIRNIFIEKEMNLYATDEKNKYEAKKNNYSLLPLFMFMCLIFLLLLPLITTLFFSFLGFKTLGAVREEVNRGRLINAEKLINSSSAYFYLAKKTSLALLLEAKAIGRPNGLDSVTRNIKLGEDMSSMGLYFIESLRRYSMVFMNKSKNPKADFIQAGSSLKNSIVLLQKIQAEERVSSSFDQEIKDLDPLIKFAEGGIDILPNIFGFEGEKTYLILFQNNLELRPAGGAIGSYALLTISEGIVKDFSIHDVYNADKQLKGHVEPPYPIRRFLSQEHWYLRDSNFDIDFVKSASRSSFFFFLETDKEVDGVVAIDLSFLKNLMSATGPIYLSEYKQLVHQNNLFELTKQHAEKDSSQGVKQKRDFLRSLYGAILSDIPRQKNLPYLALAKAVSDSLLKKHLLFAFAAPSIQDFFTVNNWSSAIWDKRLKTEDTINDFIGINEANLGSNKVNYYIKRKVSYDVDIDNGKTQGTLTIVYKNTSAKNSFGGGDYKNYLRIILQPDAELLSISIDGIQQSIVEAITSPKVYEAKNFVLPKGLEVDKTQIEGKTIYGFITSIKAEKEQTLTVKYSFNKKVPLKKSLLSYNLRFFKQPGTDEYPFVFSLSYPSSMNVISESHKTTRRENKVFFSRNITSDEIISIDLAQE